MAYRLSLSDEAVDELFAEIRNEMCSILMLLDGSMQRVVAVVVLWLEQLEQDDGLVFVELARLKGDVWAATCRLPATKRNLGELPSSAFSRMLSEKGFDPADLFVHHIQQTVDKNTSLNFHGIQTLYHRTVHHATLDVGVSINLGMEVIDSSSMASLAMWSDRDAYKASASNNGQSVLYAWFTHAELRGLQSSSAKSNVTMFLQETDVDGAVAFTV